MKAETNKISREDLFHWFINTGPGDVKTIHEWWNHLQF